MLWDTNWIDCINRHNFGATPEVKQPSPTPAPPRRGEQQVKLISTTREESGRPRGESTFITQGQQFLEEEEKQLKTLLGQ